MLGLIAVADLPMPTGIRIMAGEGILALTCQSLADGMAWSARLGGSTSTYVNSNGNRYLAADRRIDWHGWSVHIHAHEPAGDQPGHDQEAIR